MDIPRIPSLHRTAAGLGLGAIALPVVLALSLGGVPDQQQPGDLPGTATTAAYLLGTSEARLASCRSQHEACFIALATSAAQVYMVQTAVAPVATVTP